MSVADEARRTAADTLAAIFNHRDTPTHDTTNNPSNGDGDSATPTAA